MAETKIVCLGDSLTEGYGIPAEHRWTDLLAKATGREMVNRGISGDTTAGMLSRFYPDVVAQKPSHVIILGGTNDISLQLMQEHIIANIITMARQARHYGIEAIIGIPTPFMMTGQYLPSEIFLEPQLLHRGIQRLQENLHQLALEKSLHTIDFSFGMTAEYFMEDGVHPNLLGQRLMKENARNALERIL